MQEMWVWSLDWENPLEKEIATLSSILAWEIPRMKEPGGLQSTGCKRAGHDWVAEQQCTLQSFPLRLSCACKESWAPKNWCFWTVVLERLLRVPWTARRSNKSILREINPEYSLGRLMLKLQYVGYLRQRVDSLEKTLMLGKTEGGRRRGWQDEMASPTQWTWV